MRSCTWSAATTAVRLGSAVPRRRRSASSGSRRSRRARRPPSTGSIVPSTPPNAHSPEAWSSACKPTRSSPAPRSIPSTPGSTARAPVQAARAAPAGRHARLQDRPPFAGAPNLVRVVVEGETASEWLRLTVDRARATCSAGSACRSRRSSRGLVQHPPRRRHRRSPGSRARRRRDQTHRSGRRRLAGSGPVLERAQRLRRPGAVARRPARHAGRLRRQPRPRPARVDRPRRQYGTAILSSHPIVYSRTRRFRGRRTASNAAARGRDRRRRHPRARRQHPPAAQQRGRAARPDRADRRTARSGQHPGDPGRRPQRPSGRGRARAAGAALRRRVDARRDRRRVQLSRQRAERAHRLRAHHPGRGRPLRAHAGLSGLRSPPGDRGPRAAAAAHPSPRRSTCRPIAADSAWSPRARSTRSPTRSSWASAPAELDVQITEDGDAVVTHDRTRRPAKCRDTAPAFAGDPEFPYVGNYIRDLTLAQVRTLACDKPLPQFPHQRVVPGARMPLLATYSRSPTATALAKSASTSRPRSRPARRKKPRHASSSSSRRPRGPPGRPARPRQHPELRLGRAHAHARSRAPPATRRAHQRRLPAGRSARRLTLARWHRHRRLRRQPRRRRRIVRRRRHLPRSRQPARRRRRQPELPPLHHSRPRRRCPRLRPRRHPLDGRRPRHHGLPDGRRCRWAHHRLPGPPAHPHGRTGLQLPKPERTHRSCLAS